MGRGWVFFVFGVVGAFALGGGRAEADDFRAARTVAERRLEAVLHAVEGDEGFMSLVADPRGMLPNVKKKAEGFFTKALMRAWRKAEKNARVAQCNDQMREGDHCGLDYDPLHCAQDDNRGVFLYRTEQEDNDVAVVSLKWQTEQPVTAVYRLVKSGGVWKIDGVRCVGIEDFHF